MEDTVSEANSPGACEARACENPVPRSLEAQFRYSVGGIASYLVHKQAQGLSFRRLKKLNYTFRVLERNNVEPKSSDNVERLQRILLWIHGQEYKDSTKADYLVILKGFYEYHKRKDLEEQIRIKNPKIKLIKPDTLITWEDVLKAITHTKHTRLIAFTTILYDSGARIGELMGLKYCDILKDQHGIRLYVDGKTGPRMVRLQRSPEYLLEYLPYCPREGPIFAGSYRSYWKNLKRLFREAKVSKPCNPHFFRHSRLSELSNYLSESQLKKFAGWTAGSKMLNIYIHLGNDRLDEALLKIRG